MTDSIPLLVRGECMSRLAATLESTAVFISAPPGFGKTVLVRQWLEGQPSRTALWVDSRTGVVTGVRRASTLAEGLPTTCAVGPVPLRHARYGHLRCVLDRLRRESESVTLVLEDMNGTNSADVHATFHALLSSRPANLQLIGISRSQPSASLITSIVAAELREITAQDLRFTVSETAELFARAVDAATAAKLQRFTAGWPAALQLIRIWWERAGRPSLDDPASAARFARVFDYFEHHVLAVLTPPQRDFLTAASILDPIDPAVADSVLEIDSSAALLTSLTSLAPLVERSAAHAGHFDVAPIVRAWYAEARSSRGSIFNRQLHQRAASCYAARGDIVAAIDHANRAGRPDDAVRIFLSGGGCFCALRYGVDTLRRMFIALPAQAREFEPRVKLVQAILLMKEASFELARVQLRSVKASAPGIARTVTEAEARQLEVETLFVETMLRTYMGASRMTQFATTASRMVNAADPLFVRPVVSALEAVQLQRVGDLRGADKAVNDLARSSRLVGARYFLAWSYLHRGTIACARGALDLALSQYRRAQKTLAEFLPCEPEFQAIVNALIAEVRYEQDDQAAASGRVHHALQPLERGEMWIEAYGGACTVAAALAFAKSGLCEALASVERGERQARALHIEPLATLMALQRVFYLLKAGKLEAAVNQARQLDLGRHHARTRDLCQAFWRVHDWRALVSARLSAATDSRSSAVETLSCAIDAMRAGQRMGSLVRAQILLAITLKDDDPAGARSAVAEAIQHAAPRGLLRAFVEEFADIAALLPDPADERSRQFVSAIHRHARAETLRRNTYAFNERELDVLQALRAGQPNKQIARRLGISENTVKYHLKHIYAKLDVHNRREALGASRQLSFEPVGGSTTRFS